MTEFPNNLNGVDLLVVEDDPASLLIISRILSNNGARVQSVGNGRDALLKFKEQHFPIIITDINMPGMSGIELARQIKEIAPETKIIATSANREADSFIAAIELGFVDYILKPIEVGKLLLSVQRCCYILNFKRQLASEREKFRTVVECLGDGISIKDLDYRIIYQNRAMTEMFGDQTGSACYLSFGYDSPCPDCPTVKALSDNQTHRQQRSYQHNGKTGHIESTASLIRDAEGTLTGTVEIIRDITERINNEQTIRDLAFHDPLTGLANRRLFEDRLEQAIAKSYRYGMKFGLLYLDLDHFKNINDSYGHEVGDLVLVEAAQRIKTCCKRDLDTIGRQGGDEFCLIITDCGGRENLAFVAEKLLEQFTFPFDLGDMSLTVTTSIGISIYPDNSNIAKELEIAADRAMYAAKKAGRNVCRFWELI